MQITNCRSERVCKFFSVSWWGIFFLCVHRGAFCDLLFLLCLREFHVCNIAFSATWGGAKLSDVLKLVGLTQCTIVTPLGGRHVEFTSVDNCKVSGSHMAYDEIWCFSFILILSVVLSDACFMIGGFSSRSIHLIFFFLFACSVQKIGGKRWSLQGLDSLDSSHKSWSWCFTCIWNEWQGIIGCLFQMHFAL